MYNTDEKEILVDYLRKRAEDSKFVKSYLLSGLAGNYSFGGVMTPELFREYFYIPRDEAKEQEIQDLLDNIFDDSEHNVFAIKAHGGSGKTVFVNLLPTRIEKTDIEFVSIDFERSDIGKTGFELVISKILHSTRKWLEPIFDPYTKQSYQIRFREYTEKVLTKLPKYDSSGELCKLWRSVCNEIFTKENIEVTDRINIIVRSLSFERITDLADAQRLIGVQVACLLLATLILSKPNDSNDNIKQYIIEFDNIEAISSKLSSLPQIITRTWTLLNNIFRVEAVDLKFTEKIYYLLVVRTTTEFPEVPLYIAHDDVFWGSSEDYIYDLNYNDFCAKALLKKLKFLYDNDFRGTKLYKNAYLVCSLICTDAMIQRFLRGEQEENIDYKFFTREKLSRFFGNNYRQVITHISDLVTDKKIQSRITSLLRLYEEDDSDINTNGARNILFHYIFSKLSRNRNGSSIFSYFGIDYISGEKKHSMTRIILSFLYWDMVKHNVRSKGGNNYEGVQLKRLIDSFKYHYVDDEMEEFAKTIYKLSQLPNGANKAQMLSQWSYLIVIKNKAFDSQVSFLEIIKSYLENNTLPDEVKNTKICLSDAGLCYMENIANQFEFYNSRKDNSNMLPLFMLDNTKNDAGQYSFVEPINYNYNAVRDFAFGMINSGEKACFNYKKNSTESICYKEHLATDFYDIFNCALFIRYLEISSTIIEAINYINRYRLFLFKRFNDIKADTCLLNLISKYADLLKEVQNKNAMFNDFIDKPYITLFKDSKYKGYLDEVGIKHYPQRAIYFENNGVDIIDKALESEKEFHLGRDLYNLCESIIINEST